MNIDNILKINYNLIKGEKKDKFDEFRRLLLEYNQKYNLTTIVEENDMMYKHFLDSSVGTGLIKTGANVCEIGSGAGFPSIVLKILRDDLSFTLMESVGKKCEFLRVVVDNLGLSRMNIMNIRAEDAAKDLNFREKFDYVVARAVARMNTLCEYCMPFVKVGGSFIAYKSGDIEELIEAQNACRILGGEKGVFYPYSLPENYGKRNLDVVKKIKSTPNKYPRGQGKERKQPLI